MKLQKMYGTGVLLTLVMGSMLCRTPVAAAQGGSGNSADKALGNDPNDAKINAIPLERLVTSTCRQAWHLGGNNEDAFFDIVERLTDLSAHNRGVTLPDDKTVGSLAGRWIRTQSLNDPDQLLYAVVDHAVLNSIHKGTSMPVSGKAK